MADDSAACSPTGQIVRRFTSTPTMARGVGIVRFPARRPHDFAGRDLAPLDLIPGPLSGIRSRVADAPLWGEVDRFVVAH